MKFFICKHCKNIITFLNESGVPVVCCGENMEEITANSVDAAKEKHVPVVKNDNGVVTVTVGDVLHPMEEKHYIKFIVVETTNGFMERKLNPNDAPTAQFVLAQGEEVKTVYAYCNLHGLWKA